MPLSPSVHRYDKLIDNYLAIGQIAVLGWMLTSDSGTEPNNRLFTTHGSLTTKESTIMKNERQPFGQDRPGMRDQTLASVPIEDAAECKTSVYARPATRRVGRTQPQFLGRQGTHIPSFTA